MIRYSWLATGLLAFYALCAPPALAQSGELEELWMGGVDAPEVPGIRIEPNMPPVLPAAAVSFPYRVIMGNAAKKAHLVFQIIDGEGGLLHEARTPAAALDRGETLHAFSWDASSLPAGTYQARLALYLSGKTPAVTCAATFDRVSAAWMVSELDRCAQGARRVLEGMGGVSGPSYQTARAAVMLDSVEQARQALGQGDWRGAARLTAYARTVLSALDSASVFGGLIPETQYPAGTGLARLTPDGLRDMNGLPACLIGERVGAPTTEALLEALERMSRHAMNLAVVRVSELDAVGAAPFDGQALGAALRPVLDAAERSGISVVLQLSQQVLSALILDKAPDLADAGFANLAHPALSSALSEQALATALAVRGHPALLGLSFADAPDFKFDGEEVRLGFVRQVRERYPDRQELNRAWRAHLADHDEITIWGDYPEHSYQNRRAYQFEWQMTHRALVGGLLGEMRNTLSMAAPEVPLMAAMPATAFEKGETRHRPDREALSSLFAAQACTDSVRMTDSPYVWDYPRPVSHYALLRSFAPDKPVIDLGAAFECFGDIPATRRAAMVRSALWTSLIAGASGIAAAGSADGPSSAGVAEAFAITALDARRLAPVIRAFQTAPAPVAILYSESSKILDDGVPHLKSVEFAFEGCSFSGYNTRFVTERQIEGGALSDVSVFVMPETPAITNEAFARIAEYVEKGGTVLRVGTPIPYDERGHSRTGVIRNTAQTVLVRGLNMPTEYLHAMDAAIYQGVLPKIPRPVNAHGYPLEGVFTRHVEFEGVPYLYCVNLRPEPVRCQMEGTLFNGRDLILGRDIQFPRLLEPMDPMLVRLERGSSETEANPFS